MGGIIYFIFGLLVFIVAVRFVFRLLGANPSNGFVATIYSLSAPLVAPFAGIFGQPTGIDEALAGGVFEWASLIAIVVYGLIAAVVSRAAGSARHRRV